jgi:hypothetical protein
MVCGKASVGGVVLLVMQEKRVFYSESVCNEDLEKVVSVRVAYWDAVRSECVPMFNAISDSDSRIDVST